MAMRRRSGRLTACATLLVWAVSSAPSALAQTQAAQAARPAGAAKRTWLGQPNLEGTWEANYILSMEAPPGTPSLTVSEAQAKKVAATIAAENVELSGKFLDPEVPESMRTSDGLAIVRGQRRTRAVIQPADGMLPYTPQARKSLAADPPPESFDNPEDRPNTERCLYGITAPPLMSLIFLNRLQIIQTRDQVVIHTEYGDDVRVVPFAAKHGPAMFYARYGDSIAHWEGATLVIETIGLPANDPVRIFPLLIVSGDSKVIERLTRVSKTELLYQFTVVDPKTYTAPWMAEFSWRASSRPMYEHACHEGNHSLPGILAGARHDEAVAAQAATH